MISAGKQAHKGGVVIYKKDVVTVVRLVPYKSITNAHDPQLRTGIFIICHETVEFVCNIIT